MRVHDLAYVLAKAQDLAHLYSLHRASVHAVLSGIMCTTNNTAPSAHSLSLNSNERVYNAYLDVLTKQVGPDAAYAPGLGSACCRAEPVGYGCP
jgi:hypothetical protein